MSQYFRKKNSLVSGEFGKNNKPEKLSTKLSQYIPIIYIESDIVTKKDKKSKQLCTKQIYVDKILPETLSKHLLVSFDIFVLKVLPVTNNMRILSDKD